MADYQGGLKGAAGGAMTGAALGSVVPGVGTAIGAGVGGVAGGLLGLFGGGQDDAQKRLMEEYRRQIMGREAPQIADPSTSRFTSASTSDFRTNQQALVGRLEALANGTGPSVVDAQLRQATDRNTATQQSIAQSGRGNATLANIVAANNSNNYGQQAAQTAVAGRLAEQQQANAQLSGSLQGMRGQDESLSSFNAGQANQNNQFNAQQQNFANQSNLEAKLRTMGLNDQAILNVMQQVNGINAKPTLGDQLLAGGTGALGMFAGQKYGGVPGSGAGSAPGTGIPAPGSAQYMRQGGY